jgi:hypothetical protein
VEDESLSGDVGPADLHRGELGQGTTEGIYHHSDPSLLPLLAPVKIRADLRVFFFNGIESGPFSLKPTRNYTGVNTGKSPSYLPLLLFTLGNVIARLTTATTVVSRAAERMKARVGR